jgi:hypothetical protein
MASCPTPVTRVKRPINTATKSIISALARRLSYNDGYQLLESHRALLALMARYPNVRVFCAGHKNVPSMLFRNRTLHLLSPQLIQAPCAYDMIGWYEGGVNKMTYEIDEQHYVELARSAYQHDWAMRYGDEESRNFWHAY